MSKTKKLLEIVQDCAQNSRRFQPIYHNHFEVDKVVEKIANTQPINNDVFERAFAQPIHICVDDIDVPPPDIHLLKRLVCHIPIPQLLPKHWEPKGEYVEVFSGKDHTYVEKIIPKSEMKQHILDGWSITRLTKVSRSMVYKKWANAIIAMEK